MRKGGREIWVADSETDPFELGVVPKPFIWGLYNGDDYFVFTDTDAFVDFVATKRIILYAHNGGKFDWHFLSHRFEPDNSILVIAGRLSRFNIGECEFRDSINIYNKPLSAFQKDEFDYNKMDRDFRHLYMDEIKEYLRSDCEYLYQLVSGFINEYGLHITTATAAMKFWQLRLKNKVPRSDEYFYNDFSRFYFGGRVQCFVAGDFKTPAQSADINSAYPAAMLSDHPYSLHYTEGDGKPKNSPANWGPMFFDIECVAHGAFCYRGTNGTLYYPDDDIARIYHVTGWELLAAIDTKTAEQIKFLVWYRFEKLKNFSEYINLFWEKRLESKKSGDEHAGDFAKLMMNSLYGKFAANPNKYKNNILANKNEFEHSGDWELEDDEICDHVLLDQGHCVHTLEDGEGWHDFREWVIVEKNQDKESKRFYNLATAASITGYVRAKLWTAICDCDTPMYCDTDSITAKGFGKSVTISDKLGDWGIEHVYNRVIVCGKKLYAMRKKGKLQENEKRWKIASKGARLNENDIIKIAAGKTVTYKNIAPTFSVAKSAPTFLERQITATAGDSRIIPKRFDPKYTGEKENET